MNNGFFNSDFDSIFRRMMQDMQGSNQVGNKKYYINGKEVSPEELAQLTQQGGNHSAEQSAQAFQQAAQRQQGGNGNYLEQIGRNLTQEARDGLLDPVIGRDKEIQETAEVLSRRTKNNPILVGEAGVGKTAIVEGLAQAIVEGNVPAAIKDKEIISVDISSLEAGTQYRGAFEENIQKLIEGVKSSQNAVLFFDEIEKANPQILTLLLQVMDDGNLTDGQGNVINFKNTIIICTSNAGFGNGNDAEEKDIMHEMKKFFRPEFLNRFNGIVEFLHLDKDALQDIVNLLLDDVQVTLDKKGITMDVSQDAKDWLIEEGYDEELGARPLRRIVEQQVRDKITDYYLDHTDVKHVDIDVEDNELVVKGK
ncbi:TPA: ATP-dependent Clp protease ATP-binding subunit [Staphylococcus aureus]|nr:ATP-dependent Clp protease ATP-binding subunit [Staphylococcus aureus]